MKDDATKALLLRHDALSKYAGGIFVAKVGSNL